MAQVNSGQDFLYGENNKGSGVGAYIFDTSARKPLDIHLDIMDSIKINEDKKAAVKDAEKKAMDKSLGEFAIGTEGAWQFDIPAINDGITSLHNDYVESLKAGQTPTGNPEYRAKQLKLEGDVQTSIQQKKMFEDSYAALYDDRDKANSLYDWEASALNFEKFKNSTLEERKAFGELLVPKKDDLYNYAIKAFEDITPEIQENLFSNGTLAGTKTSEQVSPERLSKGFRAVIESNPEVKQLATDGIASLSPSAQKSLSDRVAAKQAKGEFITPEEQYMIDTYGYLAYKENTIKAQTDPNAGRNFDKNELKKGIVTLQAEYAKVVQGDKNVFSATPGKP